ncbi:MAG: Unknown protein [uncultured Sulfurovum sp.]|uniref:Uncharacterized protein n=1 Tax=uncultured Sulfurovum sp. TaxID=269237 RepID=A0A6S6SCX0_9BACT|nr:MAG: Unknown protein [uncultured Sulfurovum sp.]
MQQVSVSEIQRNLHKLNDFDIIEVIDKKRNKIKGYFIDGKYAAFVEEKFAKMLEEEEAKEDPAGSLHSYANLDLIEKEEDAWQRHVLEKYRK